MDTSWITLYPDWYVRERELLAQHYPEFKVDEKLLRTGRLVLYGNLVVRPAGGAKKHPILLAYPEGTPFEHPIVTPIESLPEWKEDGGVAEKVKPKMLDHRHQMSQEAGGYLCLFQRETRVIAGGDVLDAVQILKRAEKWFMGHHIGRWPPDTAQSELEAHFFAGGDALLAETFFDPKLDGHGRFFFVQDFRRLWEARCQDLCPIIITAMTKESGLIQMFDARAELSRFYPWIENSIWDAMSLEKIEDFINSNQKNLLQGYWWSLEKEPPPFHNGAGLLSVLGEMAGDEDKAWEIICAQLKGELLTAKGHYFALRYPAREDGFEWLILWMNKINRSCSGGVIVESNNVKRKNFKDSPLGVIRAHRIKPSILWLRNSGVVDNVVEKKSVALIGLGALGSKVAELLAQAGVGQFRLCDNDHLTTGNVARHVGSISDFGSLKTNVVMSRLLGINPYLQLTKEDIINNSVVSSLDVLANFMAPADLTICTTADESVESIVNQIAVLNRKPVLYGRSIRRGSMGRVFLVRSGQDACKACLADYLTAGRNGKVTPHDWIDVPDDDGVIYHECGRPIIASSAIDLSFTASLIARVALNVLEGREVNSNYWLWSRFSAPDIDPRLDSDMVTFVGHLQPRAGCPACQEPDIVELTMADEVRAAITSMTESYPDVEAGGVLIGFVDGQNRAVAVRATDAGPKAVRSATVFHRDIEYIQAELDKAASELGPRGIYIGEWHSHLVAEPKPSPDDIKSLFGISKAPNYLTRCPVMVISGFDPNISKVTSLRSWVFPVGGRIYDIPNQTVSSDVVATFLERPVISQKHSKNAGSNT